MNQWFRLITLLLIVTVASGCAYFNSFYNTKHYFDLAEKDRIEATTGKLRVDNYNKSIESGSRLIEYYPESEYIDDALFIIGQAYYWIGDYHKARRKFEELQSNYPESGYIDDSRLWLGKTYVQLKKRQESTNILRSLIADTDDPELLAGAQFALAELYFNDSLFSKAEEEFLGVIEVDRSKKYSGEAYWRAGDAAIRAHDYPKAAEYLRKSLRYDLPRRLNFRIELLRGRALRLAGDLKTSRSVLSSLLADKRYFKDHGEVRVELALTLHELGKVEEAQQHLDDVVELYPRSEVASHALYEAGIWQLDAGNNLEARDLLERARSERARTLYSLKADTMLTLMDRVSSLGKTRSVVTARIDRIEQWLASPANPSDASSFFGAAWYDSLAMDSLKLLPLFASAYKAPESPTNVDSTTEADSLSDEEKLLGAMDAGEGRNVDVSTMLFDPAPVLDTLAQLRVELQDARFQLGEILLFDMASPDSAEAIFNQLAHTASVDSVRARALLALAYIEAIAGNSVAHDSLLATIGTDYGGTRFGRYVRERSGEDISAEFASPDRDAYLEAEELFVAGDYQQAFSRYMWLIEKYPNSRLLPASMYAAGYIAARYLDDLTTAESMFGELTSQYPTTSQGVQANNLLAELDRIKQQELADSLGGGSLEGEDALSIEEVEQEPVMVGGIDALASVLDSRNLLPQEIIQGTGGEVLLRYIVHADGSVSGFRVILEDPPGRGLGRALISGLEQMEYRPGFKDGEKVAVRVENRFTLPLDAPPNIRPLPKRR